MHTTASSLVAIAQYFWGIWTSVLYGNQQKFNIEAVNDYPPIRDSIRTEISDSQISSWTYISVTRFSLQMEIKHNTGKLQYLQRAACANASAKLLWMSALSQIKYWCGLHCTAVCSHRTNVLLKTTLWLCLCAVIRCRLKRSLLLIYFLSHHLVSEIWL